LLMHLMLKLKNLQPCWQKKKLAWPLFGFIWCWIPERKDLRVKCHPVWSANFESYHNFIFVSLQDWFQNQNHWAWQQAHKASDMGYCWSRAFSHNHNRLLNFL
jgi:hypothetical protein